jgi:type II secretory pathway component PulM
MELSCAEDVKSPASCQLACRDRSLVAYMAAVIAHVLVYSHHWVPALGLQERAAEWDIVLMRLHFLQSAVIPPTMQAHSAVAHAQHSETLCFVPFPDIAVKTLWLER